MHFHSWERNVHAVFFHPLERKCVDILLLLWWFPVADVPDMEYLLHLIDLLAKLYRKQLAKIEVAEHCQNGLVLRKESDKVVSILHTCSTA